MDVNGGNYPQLDGFYIYLLLYVCIWYMYIMENPINMYDLGVPRFQEIHAFRRTSLLSPPWRNRETRNRWI